MKTLMLLVTAASAAMILSASIATAQPQQCNEREEVIKLLAERYREGPVAFGVTNNGGLVEVLKSAPHSKDDTWTIIITSPKGVSCLVAAGEGWRPMEQMVLDPET